MAKTKTRTVRNTDDGPREAVSPNWTFYERVMNVAKESLQAAWLAFDEQVIGAAKSQAEHAKAVGAVIAAGVSVFRLHKKSHGNLPDTLKDVIPHLRPLMTARKADVSDEALRAIANPYVHLIRWSDADLMSKTERELYDKNKAGAVIGDKRYPDPITALSQSGASFTGVHDAFWDQVFSGAKSTRGRKADSAEEAIGKAVKRMTIRAKGGKQVKVGSTFATLKIAVLALCAPWKGLLTTEQRDELFSEITAALGPIKGQTADTTEAAPPAAAAGG